MTKINEELRKKLISAKNGNEMIEILKANIHLLTTDDNAFFHEGAVEDLLLCRG